MHTRVALILCLSLAAPAALGSEPSPSIRGFTSRHTVQEREREKLFQSVPSPAELRENMRTISAEPHHAGGPGSRRVAEFILAKFKSWGLNASIEEFQALMPYPTERVVELLAPERYVAKLKEPVVPEDPDSGDADQLPTFNAYSADGDVTADVV